MSTHKSPKKHKRSDKPVGSILDCGTSNLFFRASLPKLAKVTDNLVGIPEIEDFAMQIQLDLVMGDTLKPNELDRMATHTQVMIEFLTRKSIQPYFAELLVGRLDEQTLKDLEKVLFELTYPTPIMPTGGAE